MRPIIWCQWTLHFKYYMRLYTVLCRLLWMYTHILVCSFESFLISCCLALFQWARTKKRTKLMPMTNTHTYTLTQSTAKMFTMWFFTNIQMFTTFCFTPSILSNINKYSVKCHYFGVVGVQTKHKIRFFIFVCFASNCSNATLSETHASNSMYVHVWTRKKK